MTRRFSTPAGATATSHATHGPQHDAAALSPRFMTIARASELYGPSRATFYRLLGTGAIAAKRVGSRTFLSVASLDAWFAAAPAYRPGVL